MEIKDPIHGAVYLSPAEVAVLDSAACQRLRQIKQLGFAEYAFPGGVHNRYIHSLGVCHLSGRAFDIVFRDFRFSSQSARNRLQQSVRLAAMLHDIGHGPLSHTTEEVMPMLRDLGIPVYRDRETDAAGQPVRASHEDYTIKYLLDSPLTRVLQQNFPDLSPYHVACLIDKKLPTQDDFFVDQGLCFRPILSQIVSSEMDVDRMDYLERDAYFCGTNYGKVELSWLLSNLTRHENNGQLYLALDRRALYTFDDFLISRHHMYLMVYFHHKSIIYEEMLTRYLNAPDCTYQLPASIEAYNKCTDYSLYEHLASSGNPWAQRISERRPYRMAFELHALEKSARVEKMQEALEKEGFATIGTSSQTRLSKYHATGLEEKTSPIFVVDQYDPLGKPERIENCTEIFQKYEENRCIERLYVAPEKYTDARRFIADRKL